MYYISGIKDGIPLFAPSKAFWGDSDDMWSKVVFPPAVIKTFKQGREDLNKALGDLSVLNGAQVMENAKAKMAELKIKDRSLKQEEMWIISMSGSGGMQVLVDAVTEVLPDVDHPCDLDKVILFSQISPNPFKSEAF